MNSPLHSFLLAEVPDWNDDVASTARFKALTGQRIDWEPRFLFWKDLIVKTARHLDHLTIDADAVCNTWFLREGLNPLCLNQVLAEMCKSGDLEFIAKGQNTSFGLSSIWSQFRKFFHSIEEDSIIFSGAGKLGQWLVVTAILHERLARVIKSISESSWTSSCVTTITHFTKICGGEETAEILKYELLRTKRGCVFSTTANTLIQGLKVSPTQGRVSNISNVDSYMLTVYWTVEKLREQMETLENAYVRSKLHAIEALQQNDRNAARRHLRSMRVSTESKSQCASFQERIHELLLSISQAEMTRHLSEAMKSGKEALKEYLVPLEDIQVNMNQLDEAISLQNEVAKAIGPLDDGFEQTDFEAEFSELEKEVAEGIADAVREVKSDDNGSTKHTQVTFSVDEVENAMKGLVLQPEPA